MAARKAAENGSGQAAVSRSGSSSGYTGQKLAALNGGAQAPRSFEEIASGGGGGSGGGGLTGLTRSMPALQPIRGAARSSSRGAPQRSNSSSRGVPTQSGGSRGGNGPRLAFADNSNSNGSGLQASIGSSSNAGRRELSPIGGGGNKGGGVSESASVGAMPFLNAR